MFGWQCVFCIAVTRNTLLAPVSLESGSVQIQTDTMVADKQPDIVEVNKQHKKAAVLNVAIPNDSDVRKPGAGALPLYQNSDFSFKLAY